LINQELFSQDLHQAKQRNYDEIVENEEIKFRRMDEEKEEKSNAKTFKEREDEIPETKRMKKEFKSQNDFSKENHLDSNFIIKTSDNYSLDSSMLISDLDMVKQIIEKQQKWKRNLINQFGTLESEEEYSKRLKIKENEILESGRSLTSQSEEYTDRISSQVSSEMTMKGINWREISGSHNRILHYSTIKSKATVGCL